MLVYAVVDKEKPLRPQSPKEFREWLVASAATFAAVGTVATAVFALVQISDERSSRRQQENDEVLQEERHQAEQISAWADRNQRFRSAFYPRPARWPPYLC